MWFAVICVCVWSIGAYGSARCARNWGSAAANRWRLGLASVILLALCLPRGVVPWRWELGWLLTAGVLHLGLADVALFAAYRLIGPRLATLVCLSCAVPVALVAEWLWFGRHPDAPGIALAAGIVVLVVVALAPAERIRLGARAIRLGLACGLLASLGQGLSQVIQVIGMRRLDAAGIAVDPFLGSLCRCLGGFAILLLVWPVMRLRATGDVAASYAASTERLGLQAGRRVWPWLLLTVVCGPILGIGALTLALERASSPGLVQAVIAALPVVVIPITWLLDGDRPSRRSLLAGLGAVACVIALALRE